jgi:AraC-like DNA-binding protein
MITNEHVEKFVEQARRYGKERWMLCSSGDLSWRVGNEMLVSGTGSWLRDLKKDKVAICRMMDRQCINGVKPSMEFDFHAGVYRNRQDVNVVLHFQSEFATAVACMKNKPTNFNVVAEIPCKLGRTAKSMINDRLLSAARQLLVDETLTITQVSQRLGFEYSQHFVRFFKAQTGKTPSEYRKTA